MADDKYPTIEELDTVCQHFKNECMKPGYKDGALHIGFIYETMVYRGIDQLSAFVKLYTFLSRECNLYISDCFLAYI